MKFSLKLIVALTVIGLVQGCIPAVFVAGAAAGGAVVYDHREMKTIVEDRDIAFLISEKIKAHPELKTNSNVSVTCFNHTVLLVGQVPTSELRAKAEQLAHVSKKIRTINNQITVEAPTLRSARATDSWITTKVKAALLAEKGLDSTQIKVVTEDGTVYLLGLVTKNQADIATERTQSVEGVRKIVKLFEYI